MFNDEIYLRMAEAIYNKDYIYTIIDNYQQVIVTNLTDQNGYYKNGNFVCAAYKNGNKIIISFRGTDDALDIFDADLSIIRNKIPKGDFEKAENFYNDLLKYYNDKGEKVEIEFTGHSLGGAIAQLMGAKYGNKTITFNAPGVLNLLNKLSA